jgi:hypothetical protein
MDLAALSKALKALKKGPGKPAPGFTLQQFRQAVGTDERAARRSLHELMDTGRAEFVGRHPAPNRIGGTVRIPHYALTGKK